MSSQTGHNPLDELAEQFGIISDYHDIFGRRHAASAETKRAILAAMGVKTETPEDLVHELGARQNESWRTPCDSVLVSRAGETGRTWPFRLPAEVKDDHAIHVEWTINDEHDRCRFKGHAGPNLTVSATRSLDGRRYVQLELPVPADLDVGYYEVIASCSTPSHVEGRMRLIVSPTQCYAPPFLEKGGRLWGISLQLYALRSATNWGVGDFGDLGLYVHWAGQMGAGAIGLNPLHALKNSRPYHISPYSPDSRLHLNILYVDVERIPDIAECERARGKIEDTRFHARLDALRDHETVNYEQVYAVKMEVLEILYESFQQRHCRTQKQSLQPLTERGRAFARYVREQGETLELFAVFQSLSETLRLEGRPYLVWQQWPEQYRHPCSPAIEAYRLAHRPHIRFYQYLQWIAAEQLTEVTGRTAAVGMPIGLYHDLALGSDRTGSDAWMFQDVLALDASCGAPPDAFAPEGQNWGLPPVIPQRLRDDGYRMFIQLVRQNLRYGGALRLDHVMALFRLFWVPPGLPASAGAYVRYPWEDLLGILALESIRHQAIIVGEDLGTVPDFVREKLAAYRMLSYRVFYFERNEQGEWKGPEEYPRHALAVVSTHDLPTLAGYWGGQDIELRSKLGIVAGEGARRSATEERQREKARIVHALQRERLLPDGHHERWEDVWSWSSDLSDAIHSYMARTPSGIMLVSIEDLIGHHAQVNVPGTLDTYPNWSLKFPLDLDALRADPRPRRLATVLRSIRSE